MLNDVRDSFVFTQLQKIYCSQAIMVVNSKNRSFLRRTLQFCCFNVKSQLHNVSPAGLDGIMSSIKLYLTNKQLRNMVNQPGTDRICNDVIAVSHLLSLTY